jgi:hypothetical protein
MCLSGQKCRMPSQRRSELIGEAKCELDASCRKLQYCNKRSNHPVAALFASERLFSPAFASYAPLACLLQRLFAKQARILRRQQ